MVLWIIALTLLVVFLALLLLVWLRKIQFDAVHRNFLKLEDTLGGRVVRGGFAVRPRFNGEYRGQKISISITYESGKNGRKYYIALTMQAHAPVNFTIMSTQWLDRQEIAEEKKRTTRSILRDRYLIETTNANMLKKLNFKKIENAVQQIDRFAYILVAKTGIILERVSENIVKDTEVEALSKLIEGLYALKLAVE